MNFRWLPTFTTQFSVMMLMTRFFLLKLDKATQKTDANESSAKHKSHIKNKSIIPVLIH